MSPSNEKRRREVRRFNFRALGETSVEKMKSPNDNRFSTSRQERFSTFGRAANNVKTEKTKRLGEIEKYETLKKASENNDEMKRRKK